MDHSVDVYSKSSSKPFICAPKNILNQKFSIPEPFVYYISKNAKSMVYQKLFQSCKYFLVKQSFAVAKSSDIFNPISYLLDQSYSLENVSTKIFVTGNTIRVRGCAAFNYIFQKVFYIDVKGLAFCGQNIIYKEFLFLISSGNIRHISFPSCTIKHNNGTLVELSEIMEKLPKLETFVYLTPKNLSTSELFTQTTGKKLAALPIFPNLRHFYVGTNIFPDFIKSKDYQLFKKNHSLWEQRIDPDMSIFIERKVYYY